MGKLIVLSLDESEKNIYDKILEIVSKADISIDREVDACLDEIQIGELLIIPEQHRVLRQGKEVNLTNIEFRILYMLAIHQGITLSKEKIYNYVWNGEYLQDDSNITSHVRRLRKKIENDPSQPEYIQTVRGVGYKINSVKRE
ncbi:winged helix-turn-helix domain-containing protein [Hominisplanchenecus murintestinalis]|uniref:winged helix-turn-helix domain-containing protein n=2 Tax=Bacteria TaxID=2 RepID=UPI00203DB721|nr:winged helix-turn-helix domain-containing protein [Hominisplanchenecus murintestinalis]